MDPGGGWGGSCTGTLRRSSRAKKIRLVVNERGLTVIVPRRFRVTKDLEPLLERHLEWILRSLEKMKTRAAQERPSGEDGTPAPLPGVIPLPALGEVWRVEFVDLSEKARADYVYSEGGGLIRLLRSFTPAEAAEALRIWLRLRAKDALPPLLRELSATFWPDQPVNRVFVKELRSRWGSCSSRRNVNLNCRLLFLPPDLVRHVMLHELCHLLEMNHSAAFYAHLRTVDPETDRHIEELRDAWRRVPAWAQDL